MGRQRFRYDIRKEDLVRLRAAGYGRIAIANLYGCDDSTIDYWLKKYGLPTAQPRIGPSREKIEEMIASRLRRSEELRQIGEWPAGVNFAE